MTLNNNIQELRYIFINQVGKKYTIKFDLSKEVPKSLRVCIILSSKMENKEMKENI